MQRGIESQPNSPSIFEGLKFRVKTQIIKVEDTKTKAGMEIKEQIRRHALLIKEGILPESIDIADTTPYDGYSPTRRYIVRYTPGNNELSLVTKEVGRVEDFTNNPLETFSTPEEGKPQYVSLPENQQSERVIRAIKDAEWVKYGPLLVEALEKAVQKSQEAKK